MALDLVEENQLTKLSGDARFVIALARRLGWTVAWTSPQHKLINLLAPEDARNRSPINVPTTNVNSKRVRALIRQVIHASPEDTVIKAATADAAVALMEKGVSPELVRATRRQLGPPIPRPPEPRFEGAGEEDTLPGLTDEAAAEAIIDEVLAKPHEVSRRPFNARGGTGVTYESEYSDEVTYSDGTIRWECTFPGCDFSSDKSGASTSRHYVQKHGSLRMKGDRVPRHQGTDHPRLEPVSHGETAEPEPEGRPEGDRLALWLQQFIDSEVKRELAKIAAGHEEELALLQGQIDSLTTELTGCREEAERYRGNMIAVRDLLNEVVG
jgi:hypothetical protein